MKVLCVGMLCCDISISPVPPDILSRDSAPICRPVMSCGGDALNVAMGLAKLGVAVDVAGRVAADANGSFIRAECEKAGIGGKNIVNDNFCATATSFALIDTSGERHFLTDKAIFEKLTAADIPDTALPKAGIVYFGS
ncbi:MAG: carbohydrate kinase family protein, partial [Oscillospiraceae bacterium]